MRAARFGDQGLVEVAMEHATLLMLGPVVIAAKWKGRNLRRDENGYSPPINMDIMRWFGVAYELATPKTMNDLTNVTYQGEKP